MKFINFYSDP
jgi:hypothetical protein